MKKEYIIELFRDANNEWRFRIRHRNGKIVADSAESYQRKFYCKKNAEHLQASLKHSDIKELP